MKKIIHIDMDYFFAQVEIRDNPSLKGKPVAIGGPKNSRGVLSTCNYIARSFGVRSAMPTYKALELCPNLILVNSHFDKYREASREVFAIFHEYTDKVEGLSLDEAYLDITDCDLFQNSATLIAQDIRKKIFERTGLTASAGVSYNKLLAKISSDINKPNGQYVVAPEEAEDIIKKWSIAKISGVGKVTIEKFTKLGLYNFGDLYQYSKLDLINHFGTFGPRLYNYVRGIDDREVITERERKSLSVERTFSSDIIEVESLNQKLFECFVELENRLSKYKNKNSKTLFIKIKYEDFTQTTIEEKYESFLFETVQELFLKRFSEKNRKVRLLGVGIKFYSTKDKGQLTFNL